MTLIVTAGAADAEAFASVAEYDAYLLARGITNTSTTTVKENALRGGASYLANAYRDQWRGIRAAQEQSLPWPRVEGFRGYAGGVIMPFIDSDGFEILSTVVPIQVKHANIEAARLVIAGTSLEPALARGGEIKSISKGVGPLSKAITYMDGAPTVDRYTVIEGLLRGLVKNMPGSTSGVVKLVRG